MSSINAILTRLGKNIAPGETITFTLVKGPSTTSSDPINTTDKRTPALSFPRMAKFIDTVIKPDFSNKFHNGRLFEENVPTVEDDEDSDDNSPELKDEDGNIIPKVSTKKKRRWRRFAPPRRHWVLCEESEYQKKLKSANNNFAKGSSHRYEGVPEFNTSNYMLLSVAESTTNMNTNNTAMSPSLQLNVQSVHGFHSFTQPARMENVGTLQQVEQEISAQRSALKQHIKRSKRLQMTSTTVPNTATKTLSSSNPGASAFSSKSLNKLRKTRLLKKLVADDEENDIMADISFRNKNNSSNRGVFKAREELLSGLADEDVLVDGDGVLGGANDSEFGGGGRFGSFRGGGKMANQSSSRSNSKKKASAMDQDNKASASTMDGSAMAADFYTRDVSAEYEDLDYDPNEQFDNDDQDMGESEMNHLMDSGGFVGDGSDVEEDDGDEDGGDNTGSGLATSAGYKAFMAKARGDVVGEDTSIAMAAAGAVPNTNIGKNKADSPGVLKGSSVEKEESRKINLNSTIAKPSVNDTVKRPLAASPNPTSSQPPSKKPKLPPLTKDAGVAVDASGQRIISIDSVRKEIWLHNQQIPLKKLGKIFAVTNKKKDRVAAFKACLKELCTVVDDPVEGQKICRLKQHYSNMGSG